MSNKQGTKSRILDAAERLFAERGFADTSLRLITSKAEVNLASVNYHFGSKKELIQAVLARYLDTFMPASAVELKRLQGRDNLTVNEIFESLVQPLLSLDSVRPKGSSIFLQLLGRGYIESQGHLRWFVTTHYGQPLELIVALIHQVDNDIDAAELFWRLHFTLGTVVFTMASFEALNDIAHADFSQNNDVESVIKRLIPYVAAGVVAPAPRWSGNKVKELS
ncbi:TetR/AcrR family transcriptional regulator [Ferrimonas aestuarii]|uniref:TetR/AcrR family transcriptional regulator n=1 Tax=Ferrimonas aestuarii TaxID=2569539 RepID=A0A4V5NZ12_9GAMM|nr:TetR/AcrR family transcriptional regulator [Ferrimonas aestuarii]TKB51981.1 TetR/AcrR family transcriptional regulator [Ferrimonas aestuarii]